MYVPFITHDGDSATRSHYYEEEEEEDEKRKEIFCIFFLIYSLVFRLRCVFLQAKKSKCDDGSCLARVRLFGNSTVYINSFSNTKSQKNRS